MATPPPTSDDGHMIEFFTGNWLWIVLIIFFVAMHRGGHGCGMHGSHGGHAGHGAQQDTDRSLPAARADRDRAPGTGAGRTRR